MQGFFTRQRWLQIVLGCVVLFVSAACTPPSTTQTPELPTAVVTAPTDSPVLTVTVEAVEPEPTEVVATPEPTEVVPTEVPPTVIPTETPEPEPTAVALQPFDPALAAQLQSILDQTVADGYIPGTVLSVVIPGMEPWSGASGVADRQRGIPMDPSTRVRIASISKTYTAVVVLQLIEEGLIDIDAPMSTWLPGMIPTGDVITVRSLLNHTTGMHDYVEDRNYIGGAYQVPDRLWQPSEMVLYSNQFPYLFPPLTPNAWDYSSTNYVILGMIVEQVTGNTLAQEMHQRIFEPLDLENSYFPPDDIVEGMYARGYFNNVDQSGISLSIVYATANIVSTTEDVSRFGQALLNGELLQPQTMELLYQFENGKGQYNMPELGYGMGLMRNRLAVGPAPDGSPRPPEASTVVGHIGGFGGFRSALWTAPESGITIALGMNQGSTDPNILATRVFDAILTSQGR